jgi:hypothetical protein
VERLKKVVARSSQLSVAPGALDGGVQRHWRRPSGKREERPEISVSILFFFNLSY